MYVAVEGIDTAGKSTQIARLQQQFSDAIITKEPGGTSIGQAVRQIVLHGDVKSHRAEFLLFLADRAEHTERVIKPNTSRLVISDRSVVSGVAYAMVQESLTRESILDLNRFATEEMYPQRVFILRLSEKELVDRLSQKRLDGIEARGVTYLLRIQDALIEAATLLGIKTHLIDASNSIEEITETITKTIREEA